MSVRNDPKLYRQLSEPFPSVDKANEAISAFFRDIEEARKKHRIPDVVVICDITHDLEGEEVRGSATMKLGGSEHHLAMLARAFGAAQQIHEETLALIIAHERKAARK